MEKNCYCCDLCESQLKISKGEFLFYYDTECIKGHINKNIFLDDLLLKRKNNDKIYQCENHKKLYIYYCKICNKNICLKCFEKSHKEHEIDNLLNLKQNEINNLECEKIINNLKILNEDFFNELDIFQNEINECIKSLKLLITKNYEFYYQILYNNNKYLNYIDIENIKNLFKIPNFENYFEILKKFSLCETFLEKYNSFNDILTKEIKRLNYIDNVQKAKNLYNIIEKMKGKLRLNNDFYLEEYYTYDDYQDNSYLGIQILNYKDNKLNYMTKPKYFKTIKFYFGPKIIGKDYNNNLPNEVLFFVLINKGLVQISVKIKNIKFTKNIKENSEEDEDQNELEIDNDGVDYDIKEFNYILNEEEKQNNERLIYFIPLSENKNIFFKSNVISVFNDNFEEEKKIKFINLDNYLKCIIINENTFAFTTDNKMYFINLENGYFENNIKLIILGPMHRFLFFDKNKNILFYWNLCWIYLINVNSEYQEIIQKIEFDLITPCLYSHKVIRNDSIYFITIKKHLFYGSHMFIEYKIKNGELAIFAKNEVKKFPEYNIKNIKDVKNYRKEEYSFY